VRAIRHYRAHRIGALFLLAVLCHPLALSGHTHQPGELAASRMTCTVCAATAHVPALTPPGLPTATLSLLGAAPALAPATAPRRVERYTRSPRAPPVLFHQPVA
jgi:hypothetical protein